VAQLLADNGAEVRAQDYDMRTPLHYASTRGVVEALLAAGADVNARHVPWARTPLLDAAMHGFREAVEALLDHGADLQAKNCSHFTALHWAAWGGHTEVVKVLLARGADPYYQDDSGYDALHWAEYWGHQDVVRLLKNKMAETPCTADPQRE
jgi:ankyrin repeat protein